MKNFKKLSSILPYVDAAFQSFYDDMLNDARLSVFFESQAQIQQLVLTQKKYFVTSLNHSQEHLNQIYIKLGEFHYDLRIPYIDFIKGTEILQEQILINSQKSGDSDGELIDEIFAYFKLMKGATAKGYLNRMLIEDRKDIEMFFEQTQEEDFETYLPKALVLEKIKWLKGLLDAISDDREFHFDGIHSTFIQQWLNESKFLTLEKRTFFEELEKRIEINTQNLFYFLKRAEYLEILPLYSSLLSIYKLALMMNNAVTLEYASHIIDDMRKDQLTGLFRKDLFNELLKIEMSHAIRHEEYKVSVAYFDLDSFKTINDNFGHYSGDKVIEKIGEIIRLNIRESDLGFRIGGDEFAIIFKNATKKQAKNVCQKIKIDLTAFEFIFNEEISFNASLSIGISEFTHESKQTMQDLILSVDKKLYEAKDRGKNQIII